MENNEQPLGAVFSIFNKLSMQQRMMIGGIFGVMIVMLAIVFMTMSEPSYTILYSNISSDDATKVIDHLNGQKIPYKLDAGQTISVPENKIYEVRIALASKGVPSSGFIGYEVFDNNTMGMSEFMQKLNFKRALEGEIAKTIVQMRGIEHARVNIVFPEKSIFKQEQIDPTASVALKTSRMISESNINAITHLVSSSVEGLRPEKVTIVDSQGRLLTKQFEENTIDAISGKQYEVKSEVENYLAGKAQAILDKVVGYGNSDRS
ncbi:MAG: flagellar basal-body MS-ring/collar protein FliF, partial [Rhodothermaceae bacterium]